jgi:hypothetical protein
MGRLVTSNSKDRDLTDDPAYRSFLITRRQSPAEHRFGAIRMKRLRVHTRRAFVRVDGHFKNMFRAIAGAEMRRSR